MINRFCFLWVSDILYDHHLTPNEKFGLHFRMNPAKHHLHQLSLKVNMLELKCQVRNPIKNHCQKEILLYYSKLKHPS